MVLGLFESPEPYLGQDYAKLKKQAQADVKLFEDPHFPASDKALFTASGSGASKMTGIEWKRPKDICKDPKLFVEGASSGDVTQGSLGNCWFVASCSALTQHKEIWRKVIPEREEQEWNAEHPEHYAGIFHFQFWRYGGWIDVVVDDRLPVRGNRLVYVHSKTDNEFWSALLEKAYAKLFGCYEALDGGELAEALEDFTGGIAEPIDLVEGNYANDEAKRDELYSVMKQAHKNNALQAAAIPAKSSDEMEQSTDIGLVKGHAYGITAVKRIALAGSGLLNMFNRDKLSMIRLRNPWGGTEWKGPFSDGSPEWEKIDQNEREKVGLTFEDDGEFWMMMDDYCKYFTNMSICRVVNTSFFSLQKTWHEGISTSEWSKANNTTGGCINNRDTFLHNPMFRFDVDDQKEDEVLIGLTQKQGRGEGEERLTIGFTILKVEDNRQYKIHRMQEVVKSSTFKNARSIIMRETFPHGRYCLIATTFDPGHAGQFLLRVYAGMHPSAKELLEDKPVPNIFNQLCGCFTMCKTPTLMTRIKLIKAAGLEKQDTTGGADPYAIIHTEKQKVTTPVVKDTLSPDFNTSAIFYRADPSKPVRIDFWNSNPLRDDFLGRAIIAANEECDGKRIEVDLVSKDKDNPTKVPGKVLVEVTSSHDLMML